MVCVRWIFGIIPKDDFHLIGRQGNMENQLDNVIEKIYDAALDQRGWEALLAEIASVIGAVAGLYAGLDIRLRIPANVTTHSGERDRCA
jgi:hypothetical protein